MKAKFEPLFESYTFPNGVTVKNRLALAPMTHYSSNDDGSISEEELVFIKARAKDLGTVITACANVTPNGKAFPGQPAIYDDQFIPGLKKLAETVQQEGAKAVIQIHHGGISCPSELVPDGDVVSASNIDRDNQKARALSTGEIEEIIEAFGEATRRAIEAGFDGVEIHGANGYLVQQFYSPYTNNRTDEWGGSVENRMKFPLAVAEACQRAIDKHAKRPFIFGYRFSPEEPSTPGLTMTETFQLVDALSNLPFDYLHISLMHALSTPHRGADTERTRIELVNEVINGRVPLMAVGKVNSPDDALAVRERNIPLIAIGRELLISPRWAAYIQEDRLEKIEYALNLKERDKYDIPNGLWEVILAAEGWVPFTR
ncbi:NADH-dependent flavin oxidoreductase [Cytobacillus kochii]|uniref:NADH-dependent flavin oxidoreductase n=1 Tax=Cytobacillus kochii TaxID=859143 RepID=UPI001CD1B149|nr:NADH-dependent flavin oxidoreductase [Cytobacillus kochii]MCA1025578.1 NADH-dependent flavin oxidoreductase [Cytobacillus kochii]MCM3320680.1 NADH-dependent flavin oxidoreductase [Cytobacillus kochii]MCM3344486.1 NADH-dependent flavin oxidoreductase [Cytobacillus kochii]